MIVSELEGHVNAIFTRMEPVPSGNKGIGQKKQKLINKYILTILLSLCVRHIPLYMWYLGRLRYIKLPLNWTMSLRFCRNMWVWDMSTCHFHMVYMVHSMIHRIVICTFVILYSTYSLLESTSRCELKMLLRKIFLFFIFLFFTKYTI